MLLTLMLKCYTILLMDVKIWLSLSKSLFDNVIKPLSFCHFYELRIAYRKCIFMQKPYFVNGRNVSVFVLNCHLAPLEMALFLAIC